MAIHTLFFNGIKNTAGMGKSGTAYYDDYWGVLTDDEPHVKTFGEMDPKPLRIFRNGKLWSQDATYKELSRPIYTNPITGEANLPFGAALPNLTPPVGKTMPVPIDWIPYPENQPTDVYNVWEGKDDLERIFAFPYEICIKIYPEFGNITILQFLGINKIRPKTTQRTWPVPNPEYPIVEAQRAREKEAYMSMLKQYLVRCATFIFPSIPDPALYWVKIDEVLLTPEEARAHRLYQPEMGWKKIVQVIDPQDDNHHKWENTFNNTVLMCPPKYSYDFRLRKILGYKS